MKFTFKKPLKENLLLEGIWYKLSFPSNHDYYAYLTNSKDYPVTMLLNDIINNPVNYMNHKHERLSKAALSALSLDLELYPNNYTWSYYGNLLPATVTAKEVLTPMSRDWRGKEELYLSSDMKNLIAKYKTADLDSVYIHHINGAEYDLNITNLVPILYNSSNRSVPHIAHMILHNITDPNKELAFDIDYFTETSAGTPLHHSIHISIT